MDRLKGKIAIVAGSASGMGRATTILFAKEGATVIATDINDLGLEETLGMISEGTVVSRHLDMTSEEDWQTAVDFAVREYGRVDILATIAGYTPAIQPLETVEIPVFERSNAINGKGVWLGLKAVTPIMKKQKYGSVVNVCSLNGILGGMCNVAYAASKGACRSITKTAAAELGRWNIRVNAIFPGITGTPMAQTALDNPDMLQPILADIPLGRIAKPEEMAAAILFLASDDASYITANEIIVDGGWSSHNGLWLNPEE